MLLEGIVGFAAIIAITIFVTKLMLEVSGNPVMSEQEWEIQHGTRPLTDDEMLGKFKEHQVNLIGFDPTVPRDVA